MNARTTQEGKPPRPRARDLGIQIGILPPGPLNAITDVSGVRVGHRTLIEGDSIRTGITAILPHKGNLFQDKVPAGVWVGNGFGKAAGFLQVQELGMLETPIILTNTLAVGVAVSAAVHWTLNQTGNEHVTSVNAVVGETNDGYLNDIRAMRIREEDVLAAIGAAAEGPVAEGCIGAGAGTRCLGFKGGIGTASRRLPESLGNYTLGALVQSNFGGVLSVDGLPLGKHLKRHAFAEHVEAGSCMIVIATDAPLDSRGLERLAARSLLGLGRTGGYMSHGSGDFAIAFSTAYTIPHPPRPAPRPEFLQGGQLDPLFLAAVEATEEAIINSLLRATAMSGFHSRTVEPVPIDALSDLLARRRS